MTIFCPASYTSACWLHRVVYPARYLSKDTPRHEWQTALTDPSGKYDALLIYGSQPISNFPEFGTLKRNGVKIIWGLDDSYHDWPAWRHDVPSPEVVGCVDLMAEVADVIVASTPALADELGKPDRTVTCPNLLDVAAYGTPTPPADDKTIRICWSGSATHKGDCDLMDDACCRIKEKWGDRVEFHLFGAGPDKLLRDWWGRGVKLTEWVPLSHYWSHLKAARPHICLAPLVDCQFNRCKSAIRVQESWALNAACVASPVGEYKMVRDGVDGLVANTSDEWFDAIDRLVEDRAERERLALNGWERVTSEFDWNSTNSRTKWSPLTEWLDRA